jgi:hypothetical protein
MDRGGEIPARTSVRQVIISFFFLLIFVGLLFFPAGAWRWTKGWMFSIFFFGLSFATVIYLSFKDPALLNERFGAPVQKEQKFWDKFLITALFDRISGNVFGQKSFTPFSFFPITFRLRDKNRR